MRRKAFTLVELLVVIAIIALLISILAPSLKMAKDLAKQAVCATHLRAVGNAVALYAGANRDALPPCRNSYDNVYAALLALVYKLDNLTPVQDPQTGKPMIFGQWSYLLQGELVTPDMIYCPSQSSGQWMRSSYPNPYGVAPVDYYTVWSNWRYSAGYMLNLSLKVSGNSGAWEYTRLPDFPADMPLASDILLRVYDMSHGAEGDAFPPRTGPSPTWQVAYADSHVAARSSLTAWGLMHEFGADLFADVPEWIRVRNALLGF